MLQSLRVMGGSVSPALRGDGPARVFRQGDDPAAIHRGGAEVKQAQPGAGRPPLALDAAGVAISYVNPASGTATEAVADITLTIAPGEFVTIVGLSGCGKSSFLNAVAGLVGITGGSLKAAGWPIAGPGADRAVVFQRPSLLPWRNVMDNVIYGLELQGVPKRIAREKARHYLDLVQLEGVENFFPAALSGGMQQRVNLARALIRDPELLLLDEPFGALDAITRDTMQTELLGIWERTRKTVLMVTHQIDEAILLSDRVLVFSDRPATIVEEIRIDIERPRDPGIKTSTRFRAIESHLWDLIHRTARARKSP